jgi:peptidoglycan/LPS O-acetylase OafA/YrhL
MNAFREKMTRRIVAAWTDAPRPWGNEESWKNRANNVDAVRALLALLVIWFHGPILLGEAPDIPLSPAYAQEPMEQVHFVGLRVLCFFWLNGFLLARSWERAPHVLPFLWRRVVRLYPAFLVCAALCLTLLAVIAPEAVFPGWRTITRYLITLRLPEVGQIFPRNTITGTVNGALWTLLYEGWLCVGLVLLGVLGVLRRGTPLVLLLCCAWTAHVLQWFDLLPFPLSGESFQTWIVFGSASAYPPLIACFLSGVAFHLYRERIPWHPALFAISLGGLCLAVAVGFVGPAVPIFGAYCLAFLAFHPRRLFPAWLSGWGEISYGIFLYGYPVQQLWIHYAGGALSAPGLFLATLPPVLLLAYLSRRYVELPIDRWQKQKRRKVAPSATATATALPAHLPVGVRQGS